MLTRTLASLSFLAAAAAAQVSPFASTLLPDLGSKQKFIRAGDLDGDGLPDALVTQQDGSLLAVLSLGGGLFEPPAPVFSLSGTNRTALADVDVDGDLDILACIDLPTQELLSMRRGNGDGTFAAIALYNNVNSGPQSLAVGDLDADGAPDVLVSCSASSRLSRLMGHGDGTFAPPADVQVAANLRGVALGHLDRGDDLDAAAVTSGGLLAPLLGNGTGALVLGPTQAIPSDVRDVALGDVDGDGDDDALMGFTSNEGRLALCQGDGTFAAPSVHALDGSSSRPELLDVNEDGLADAVHDPAGISVLLSLGGGALGPEQRYGSIHGSTDHAVADFSGDGDLDVLVTQQASFSSSQAVLLTGDGAGAFAPLLLTGDGPSEVAAGDLDGDGRLDLVVASEFDGKVRVHLGLPHGNVSGAAAVDSAAAPTALALGDVDEDGHLDVVVSGNVFPGALSVLYGDGTGSLGAAQPLAALASTGKDIVLADFDGDGHLDLAAAGGNGSVSILHGDGAGSFELDQVLATAFTNPPVLEAAQLNADGWPDLLAGNSNGIVNVYLTQPGGSFADPLSFAAGIGGITGLASGDLDDDGDEDVVAGGGLSAALLLNDGSGFLVTAGHLDVTHPPLVAVADVTRDGEADVITLSYGATDITKDLGALQVLAGHGDGSFEPAVSVPCSPLGQDLLVQDLDGDGAPDAALVTLEDDLAVRLNQLGPWQDLGHPLAGAQGLPRQFASGSLQPGSPFAIELADARPGGVTSHVIGLSAIDKPFKGGVFVPMPLLINYPLPLDAQGGLVLAGTWPAPAAPGVEIYLQFWTQDPAGVKGWSASNALQATLP